MFTFLACKSDVTSTSQNSSITRPTNRHEWLWSKNYSRHLFTAKGNICQRFFLTKLEFSEIPCFPKTSSSAWAIETAMLSFHFAQSAAQHLKLNSGLTIMGHCQSWSFWMALTQYAHQLYDNICKYINECICIYIRITMLSLRKYENSLIHAENIQTVTSSHYVGSDRASYVIHCGKTDVNFCNTPKRVIFLQQLWIYCQLCQLFLYN